jgi:microcin C transport system ATP-binding protein
VDRAAALLEVRNLRVGFGGQDVVHGIDFEIAAGERLALVGESGSGKSVSAMSLLRLVQNADVSGSALLEGRDLLQMSERQLRGVRGDEVAIIFQEPMTALNPLYTVRASQSRLAGARPIHTSSAAASASAR